jgi:hypothetical protein
MDVLRYRRAKHQRAAAGRMLAHMHLTACVSDQAPERHTQPPPPIAITPITRLDGQLDILPDSLTVVIPQSCLTQDEHGEGARFSCEVSMKKG